MGNLTFDHYREFCGVWLLHNHTFKVTIEDLQRYCVCIVYANTSDLRRKLNNAWGTRIEPMPEQELEKFKPAPKKEKYHIKYPLLMGGAKDGVEMSIKGVKFLLMSYGKDSLKVLHNK